MDLFLRLFWVDERLKHGMGRHVIIKDKDLLWVPDLYFRNEKRSSFHNAGSPNFVIGIYNNGSIYHSQRSESVHTHPYTPGQNQYTHTFIHTCM